MKTWKKITWLGFSVIGLWSIDYKQTGCVMSRGKKEWQRVRSRAVPAALVWCIGKRSPETKVRMVLPNKSWLRTRPVCGVRRWEEHGQGGLQTLCFSDKETEVRRVGRLGGGHTVSHRPAEPEARSPQSCRGPPSLCFALTLLSRGWVGSVGLASHLHTSAQNHRLGNQHPEAPAGLGSQGKTFHPYPLDVVHWAKMAVWGHIFVPVVTGSVVCGIEQKSQSLRAGAGQTWALTATCPQTAL